MPLEDLTGPNVFPDDLNAAWPLGSDTPAEGDNHLRGIKNVIRNWAGAYGAGSLEPVIDGKAPVVHEHVVADITDWPAAFPPAAHTHPIAEVTGLPAALDDKADLADLDAKADLAGATFTGQVTVKETAETNYNLPGDDVDPANGTMQFKAATGSVTITGSNFQNGQSVTLRITQPSSVTFSGFNWISADGAAPELSGTNNVFILWQDNGTKYVAYVGNDG